MSDGFFDFYEQRLDEKIINEVDFLGFDLETTGLNPLTDRIIEIGTATKRPGKEVVLYDAFVNPGIFIPSQASAISGITNDMIEDAPDFNSVYSKMKHQFNNAVIVAHNANFDLSFLYQETLRGGLKMPDPLLVIDTHALAKVAFPGLQSYSLQNLAKRFGIAVSAAHRAGDDAKVCLELCSKCIDALDGAAHMTVMDFITLSKTRLQFT